MTMNARQFAELRISRLSRRIETLEARKAKRANWSEADQAKLKSSKVSLARWHRLIAKNSN